MRLFAALLFVSVLLVTTGSFPAAPSKQAPQTNLEHAVDLNTPGPEHSKLAALTGTWDVTVKYPVAKDQYREGKAAYRGELVMEGRFLRQTYMATFAGKPLEIVRYIGYDRHRRKVLEVQFESTHTDVMHNEGSFSADGSTISCSGSHIDTATGRVARVRSVTKIVDSQTFTLELVYTDAESGASKTVTLVHHRREEGPA